MLPGGAAQRAKALPAFLGGVNLPLAQAEVMANLMPYGIGDDPLQMCGITGHLLMRQLENADPVGAVGRRVPQTALGERPPLIKPEQIRRWTGRLHDDYQIPHSGAEAGR